MVDHFSGDRQSSTDDLDKLLKILPDHLQSHLNTHPLLANLIEVVMDLGRPPEARFLEKAEILSETVITQEDLDACIQRVGDFSGDNRAGIERTLHRISAIRNRQGVIIGLTCRIGRSVFGTTSMIRDLVESGRSILLLGRPGVGKTTALREIARVLADDFEKRVVIIDTSNEIAGDGDVPHPAIGRARRMQVARPELQHTVMIEAVENHMPEVVVIDEIGTELEALAARTIAERGVQLIGTAHGNQTENLIKNPTLSDLVGGIQSVTLGDEEAKRRGSQKSVLERKAPPTFEIAIEMLERDRWIVHDDVAGSVDSLLRGRRPNPQVRSIGDSGKVDISYEQPVQSEEAIPGRWSQTDRSSTQRGWQATGRMQPIPLSGQDSIATTANFESLLDATWSPDHLQDAGPNGEDLPLHIYPYAVSRSQLDQVIRTLNLPIVLTKDLDHADVVLALRSHLKNHSKLRQLARSRHLPVHAIKASTIPQIARGLRRLLNMEEPGTPEVPDIRMFATTKSNNDEIEALEEARLAVEQIVIPRGQPVELLPRSAGVRKMQHELIEHYRLQSRSFGDEPNRRLRIYPA